MDSKINYKVFFKDVHSDEHILRVIAAYAERAANRGIPNGSAFAAERNSNILTAENAILVQTAKVGIFGKFIPKGNPPNLILTVHRPAITQ